jgi:hypothetical protein
LGPERREQLGTQRHQGGRTRKADLLHGLAGVDRTCRDQLAAFDRERAAIRGEAHLEPRGHARGQVASHRGRREQHDRRLGLLGRGHDRRRVSTGFVALERRMGGEEDLGRAGFTERRESRIGRRRAYADDRTW